MTPLPWWFSAAFALLCAALCSLVIGAVRGLSSSRLVLAVGRDRAARLERALEDRLRILLTVHFIRGVSLAASTISIGVAALLPVLRGSTRELVLAAVEAVLVGGVANVLLGDVLPRTLGEQRAEVVVARTLPAVALVARVLHPVTWIFGVAARAVLWIAGVEPSSFADEIRDELRSAALHGASEGVLDPTAMHLIENVIGFHDVEVSEVMTPRTEIVAISADATLLEAAASFARHGHSRMPIFEETIDRVVGILYAKDLLQRLDEGVIAPVADGGGGEGGTGGTITARLAQAPNVRALMRKPLFVPESKRIVDLLRELRRGRPHIAIVVDEHGGTAGIVTLEDIIEEIVGDIEDEFDAPGRAAIRRLPDGSADVSAKARVREVNQALNLKVPEDRDYETLGGFVTTALGRVPAKGDRLVHDGATFVVTDADERRVNRVRIVAGVVREKPTGRAG